MAAMEIVTTTAVRPMIGRLVRRVARTRERVTISERGEPAAVLISVEELADLEDGLALARYRLAQANGTVGEGVPLSALREQWGMPR